MGDPISPTQLKHMQAEAALIRSGSDVMPTGQFVIDSPRSRDSKRASPIKMLNDKVKPAANHFVSSNNNEFIPKVADRCKGKAKKA